MPHLHQTAHAPHLRYVVWEPASSALPPRTVVLAHALGCDHTLWHDLAPALALGLVGGVLCGPCRVVAFDLRGHGVSDTAAGPCTMGDLAGDALRVIDAVSPDAPVVLLGVSLGGMLAQVVALQRPERIQALVLANTTSGYPADARRLWDERVALARREGLATLADAAMQRWFTPAFHERRPDAVARFRALVAGQSPAGYAACCEAIRDFDVAARLGAIRQPTLVLGAEQDAGTPPAMARALADGIPGAQLVVLGHAAHLALVEQPDAFGAEVARFLAALPR